MLGQRNCLQFRFDQAMWKWNLVNFFRFLKGNIIYKYPQWGSSGSFGLQRSFRWLVYKNKLIVGIKLR